MVRRSCCIPVAGVDFAVLLREELGGDDLTLRELTSIRIMIGFGQSNQCFSSAVKGRAAKLVY